LIQTIQIMSVIGCIPDLTEYIDIPKAVRDEKYAKSKCLLIKKQGDLYIIKYIKHCLTQENVQTLGYFRSIITDGKKLLAYSPPKSVSSGNFIKSFPDGKDCILEEFVEGTMINCFYHNNEWKIASRWNIGAKRSFYQDSKRRLSFYDMFKEAMEECHLCFDQLDKNYCYSFVLQHPLNRIVVPFAKPSLILISIYELDNWHIQEINTKIIDCNVRRPIRYSLNYPVQDWKTYLDPYIGIQADYTILGVVLKHHSDGPCVRSKVRNSTYEKVRHLKGNSPKIQFQYYHLYQQGKIKEFLHYFPEYKQEFWNLRTELIQWTDKLLHLYKNRHIFKNINDKEIPYSFRPHVWSLHDIYQSMLREKKLSINKQIVINYIYDLPPSRLMYSINYPLRQKEKDDVKGLTTN